jgi:hypothetical protein
MLNEMRLGKVSQETINAFAAMKRTIEYEDNLAATELYVNHSFNCFFSLTNLPDSRRDKK